VTVVDTSVAVAALASWHAAHDAARKAAAEAAIPAHARLETYSVLTRLPPPHRVSATLASELLSEWFPEAETLVPSARLSRSIVERCSRLSIDGGAVYDVIVAMTAAESQQLLVTRDERAARTYSRLGISFELMS
jgi:predicted nucleic acid-binding protein